MVGTNVGHLQTIHKLRVQMSIFGAQESVLFTKPSGTQVPALLQTGISTQSPVDITMGYSSGSVTFSVEGALFKASHAFAVLQMGR